MFENFKIITVGLLVVLGFYFMFEIPVDFRGNNEVEAGTTATTSLEVGNASPSVSNITLNVGSNIRLVEDGATTVTAAATITDSNGYTDIKEVIGRLFWSKATNATNCTADVNSCTVTTTCATSSCLGNDCNATCTFALWFPATPTDADGASSWSCWIQAKDTYSSTSDATNTTQTIEVITLNALDVTDAIDYGSLSPNAKNDPLDKLVKATTTGNAPIDANILGTNMCTDYATCTAATTSVAWQKYATDSGVAYTNAAAWTASDTAVLLEFLTVKPTATPSNQIQSIYWGTWATQTSPGVYTGVNTFTVQSD